jgi:FAD/FMN-containing dehydrogenase
VTASQGKARGYLQCGLATTWNIVVYAATGGQRLWLEGRVQGGRFANWLHRFGYQPTRYVQPKSEEELVALVRSSHGVRLFGSGHSFNDGVVADDTLVSLDRYRGVVWKDLGKKQVAFRAGTRVRDAVAALLREGLAFQALPSHDAQSLGGILSTDVHGTGGHRWGFVSQSVAGLAIVDGKGDVHRCQPSDDLFKAAIGGVGAVGIISEVVVQAVDRFDVEQKVRGSSVAEVEANLDRLLEENDHFSIYLFPFTHRCQVNTWNRTTEKKSFAGPFREFVAISMDALLAAWAGNLLAYTRLLPRLSSVTHRLKRGTDLVLESNQAFNRTIYHLHQELELTVPFEETFTAARRFIELYERMYRSGLPYTFVEVRFTPAGHDRTLLGAGRDRRSAWIDLITNDSRGFDRYFDAAEELTREIGGRPHLGKYCRTHRKADLAKVHGEHLARFLELVAEHDPDGRFANDFTRRLFRD